MCMASALHPSFRPMHLCIGGRRELVLKSCWRISERRSSHLFSSSSSCVRYSPTVLPVRILIQLPCIAFYYRLKKSNSPKTGNVSDLHLLQSDAVGNAYGRHSGCCKYSFAISLSTSQTYAILLLFCAVDRWHGADKMA